MVGDAIVRSDRRTTPRRSIGSIPIVAADAMVRLDVRPAAAQCAVRQDRRRDCCWPTAASRAKATKTIASRWRPTTRPTSRPISPRSPTMPFYWARNNFRKPDDMAIGFCYTFLGVQMQCCQCHKHPFDRWTKQDFDEFSRFFTRVGYGIAPDRSQGPRRNGRRHSGTESDETRRKGRGAKTDTKTGRREECRREKAESTKSQCEGRCEKSARSQKGRRPKKAKAKKNADLNKLVCRACHAGKSDPAPRSVRAAEAEQPETAKAKAKTDAKRCREEQAGKGDGQADPRVDGQIARRRHGRSESIRRSAASARRLAAQQSARAILPA